MEILPLTLKRNNNHILIITTYNKIKLIFHNFSKFDKNAELNENINKSKIVF